MIWFKPTYCSDSDMYIKQNVSIYWSVWSAFELKGCWIMITPAFELSQEQHFLTITIHVPYARASEFDLYIDGEDFKLYAKPYFLRQVALGLLAF